MIGALKSSPEMETCRRIAFLLAGAEVALGIEPHGLPLVARLHRALSGAMENPAAVSGDVYAVLYSLFPQARQ